MTVTEPGEAKPEEVDVETLAASLAGEATVVDVRNPDEYEDGHVPGALLIPLYDLEERSGEVKDAGPVYVICASGVRSLRGARTLEDAGRQAVSVAGGTIAWMAAGHPVVRGDQPL